MQAAVFEGQGRIGMVETPTPVPGPGEVLVCLHGCGVCASNLPPFAGRAWFDYPLGPGAPGHEGWGEVAALGEGVADLRIGDPVACLSHHAFATHDLVAEGLRRLDGWLAGTPDESMALGRKL